MQKKPTVILNTNALEKAIQQLEDSLCYYISDLVQKDPGLVLQLRAAAIQAFEFTYELSWKMIKRYLELTLPNPAVVDEMSFTTLIRTACEQNLLLSDVETWKIFRKERGITSHTYDQNKAQDVFEKIPLFLKEAKFLLAKLKKRSSE